MGGKKSDKDPFADFFGDDVDWLDEEDGSEGGGAAQDPAQTLPPQPPADPPPPAPTPEGASAEEAQAEPETGAETGLAPSDPETSESSESSESSEPSSTATPAEDLPPAVPPPPPPPIRQKRRTPERQKYRSPEIRSQESQDPEPGDDAFVVAPSQNEGASLGEARTVALGDLEHDPADDTIGVFLEPLTSPDAASSTPEPASPPEDLETITDDPSQQTNAEAAAGAVAEDPASLSDDGIVIEEDAPDEITSLSGQTPDAVAEPDPGTDASSEGASPQPDHVPPTDDNTQESGLGLASPEIPAEASQEALPVVGPERVTWSPSNEETTWLELCEPIEALAETVEDPQVAATLYCEAARIRRDRLGHVDRARELLDQAREKGASDPAFFALLAETVARSGDYAKAAEVTAERAEQLEGSEAAEAWQAAAMIARHRLRELDLSERYLQRAIQADPGDYASLSLLRDQLSAKGREADRAAMLDRLCTIASGRVAAEAWWELGRLQLALDDPEAARAAFKRGREADPSQSQCLLSLQALYAHLGDDAAMGELYLQEARREGQTDRAHWAIEAARCFAEARSRSEADAAYAEAVEHGHPLAPREQQAWYLATGRPADYATALEAEVASLTPEGGRAFALYRLGWVREHDLEDPEGAEKAYRQVVDLDPAAGPAAESVARVLQRSQRFEELLSFWQARVEGSDDVGLRASVLLRMAEVAEARLDDDARARTYLEQLLSISAGDRTALDALRRIYRRLKAWSELATVYESLATLEDQPEAKAQHLARAGNVWRYEARQLDEARDCYSRALALRPGHAIALDEQVELLEELGEWSEQASVLRAAADAVSSEDDKVRYSYRSGRVWLDRLDQPERAAEAFRNCLRFRPGFLPALGMLKQIAARSNQGQEIYRLYLQQAQSLDDVDARHWRLLAAADLADRLLGGDPGRDLGAILERDPVHPGAIAAQELRLLTLGAKVGLLNLYRRVVPSLEPGPLRTAYLVRIAGLYESLGDDSGVAEPVSQAISEGADGSPFRALARLAEARRDWASAVDALARAGEPEDDLERARLLTIRLKDHDPALELYERLLEHPRTAVGAALGAAALAQRAGNSDLLFRAHAVLAEHGGTDDVRAAHALWSGQLAEANGQQDDALVQYRLALSLRPASATAFDGARRLLLHAGSAAALEELWNTYRPGDPGISLDLEQLGAADRVLSFWKDRADGEHSTLGALSELEVALSRTDDWREVFSVASRRAEIVPTDTFREVIDAKRRWLLAEKLAETDEAWELYQGLHEDNPEDRDVTSALARIALARGEPRMAIGFLENLAEGASEPREAADLQVRIAAVHEEAGSLSEARQSLFDALDHVPDHSPALDGLKRLARAESDHGALIDVLKLEAGRVDGERRLGVLREIAQITAEHVDDDALAAEAWERVLEESPDDITALTASIDLAEAAQAWPRFVELSTHLAAQLDGADRTARLSRAGRITLDELEQPAGVDLLERALEEGPADALAAARLASWYREHDKLDDVVRVCVIHAEHAEDAAERGRLFSDAGQIRHDQGDDDAAARLYRQAVEHAPDERRALDFLAEYLFEKGSTGEALPIFERLAPVIEQGQDLDDFDVRIELSLFFYRLARMLVEWKRPADALVHAERALTFNPTHQPTLELAAPLLVRAEKWGRATAVLRQLLQLTGGHGKPQKVAMTYAQLGLVERAQGRGAKARKYFERALSQVPNHVEALKGMALLYEDEEKWTQLLDVYNNVISHAVLPADVTAAYLTKGRILDERMARADKAAQHYERSLAYDANQPGVLLRLAELAWRRSDWDETSARSQRALDLVFQASGLRSDLWLCQAAARHALGDQERASEALEKARADAPERELPEGVLQDLEELRVQVRSRLPR